MSEEISQKQLFTEEQEKEVQNYIELLISHNRNYLGHTLEGRPVFERPYSISAYDYHFSKDRYTRVYIIEVEHMDVVVNQTNLSKDQVSNLIYKL